MCKQGNMKKILLALFICWSIAATAQINVVTSGRGQAPYSKAHRQRLIDELKQSTTIFILQYKDYDRLPEFEDAIKRSWTFTPYKIIRPEELAAYEGKKGFTFFTFGAYYTGKHHTTQHLLYGLWTPVLNKKEHLKSQFFYSTVGLFLEGNKIPNMYAYAASRHKYDAALMNGMLDGVSYNNWGARYLQGYLQAINNQLVKNETLDIWKKYRSDKLAEICTDTLYIPDYVKQKEIGWANATYIDTEVTASALHVEYPYPVKFVTNAELERLIKDPDRNIHYLVFAVDGSNKYIDVYSSRYGLLYTNVTLLSWTFKSKDMGKITAAINKQ